VGTIIWLEGSKLLSEMWEYMCLPMKGSQ